MADDRRSKARLSASRLADPQRLETPRMQSAGRNAASAFRRVGAVAKRVERAIDEIDTSAVPAIVLDDEPSLVKALDQAVSSAEIPVVVARTKSKDMS